MTRQGPTIAETSPEFCQGARCGHIEARDRVGQYVIDEEFEPSWEAAEANLSCDAPAERLEWWATGYRYGYRLRAEGEALPAVIIEAPLP